MRTGTAIVLDGHYAARGANTVATTVTQTCHIAALQIELSTVVRYPGGAHNHTPQGESSPFPGEALLPSSLPERTPDIDAVRGCFEAFVDLIGLPRSHSC